VRRARFTKASNKRHDELRNAGGQALRRGADAAVVHDRARARQELAQRHEVEVRDAGRQHRGDLLGVAREQDAAAAEAPARVDRGAEERLAVTHRRAGSFSISIQNMFFYIYRIALILYYL
jgi:hypothetical protein